MRAQGGWSGGPRGSMGDKGSWRLWAQQEQAGPEEMNMGEPRGPEGLLAGGEEDDEEGGGLAASKVSGGGSSWYRRWLGRA